MWPDRAVAELKQRPARRQATEVQKLLLVTVALEKSSRTRF